ncbi:MAG: tyrosine-type recombinase/integrase [Ferrimonas sp.]
MPSQATLISTIDQLQIAGHRSISNQQSSPTTQIRKAVATLVDQEDHSNKQKVFLGDAVYALEQLALEMHGRRNNTNLTFRKQWMMFAKYCAKVGAIELPATARIIAIYITDLVSGQGSSNGKPVKVNTINARLWAISIMHRYCGLADPTKDEEVVKACDKAADSLALTHGGEKQATPMMLEHLQGIIAVWRGGTAKQCRDLAVLTTAFTTMLRESELTRIRLGDIKRRNDGSMLITVRQTKTSQRGEVVQVEVESTTASLIREYLRSMAIELSGEGYLFRKVTNPNARPSRLAKRSTSAEMKPLSEVTIDNIFALGYQKVCELNPTDFELVDSAPWTGHSARVGCAISMGMRGASISEIAKRGRWSSPQMVMRYMKQITSRTNTLKSMMSEIID